MWAELKGNEAEIKEYLEEQNKVRKPYEYKPPHPFFVRTA